jgi:protoheme IX farnesyltransferase
MVAVSTLGGFYLASENSLNWFLLLHTLIGSLLVAGATNALNQLVECELDAKMKRTRRRPLPSGNLSAIQAGHFAAWTSVAGISYLALAVNLLTAGLAALTLASYILIYTPLKKLSPLSTLVGAVPGALPALGGWTAVTNSINPEGWIFFSILFFWQIPHFLAIAWIYRDDYARGGFKVLPLSDNNYFSTSLYIILNCIALLFVSLLPSFIGMTGIIYFTGALVLGLGFLFFGIIVVIKRTNQSAKQLLHVSILYLPLLMMFIFIDKI